MNVVVADKYKVRAMVNSGSTVTMMSSALFKKMSALQGLLKPTTKGFYGVGEERMKYDGILYELGLQVRDGLVVKITVAVYPHESCVMLLGNDFIGGPNAKL